MNTLCATIDTTQTGKELNHSDHTKTLKPESIGNQTIFGQAQSIWILWLSILLHRLLPYLSDCSFFIIIGNSTSKTKIWSSIRFSLGSASVHTIFLQTQLWLVASKIAYDTQIFITWTTFDTNHIKLEGRLCELQLWFCFNCLSVNDDKSRCILQPCLLHMHVANTSVHLSNIIKSCT